MNADGSDRWIKTTVTGCTGKCLGLTFAWWHNPTSPFTGKIRFGGPEANTTGSFVFHEIRIHNEYQSDATRWAFFV